MVGPRNRHLGLQEKAPRPITTTSTSFYLQIPDTPANMKLIVAALLGIAFASDTYPSCGGLLPEANACESGTCISDPRTEGCGLACDETGICVGEEVARCGGYEGKQCPEGLGCFDDPGDDCDPENGGFDCSGLCLEELEVVEEDGA